MFNPNELNSFAGVYDWGNVNAQEPYYEGQPYGSTPGAGLTADFGAANDAARQHLGPPWRMPTSVEFQELFNFCDFIDPDGNIVTAATSVAGTDDDKRIMMNGVVGLRLRSRINGHVIFFPSSGFGAGRVWQLRGSAGTYWSSTFVSNRNARFMYFNSGVVSPSFANARFYGVPVRPVI